MQFNYIRDSAFGNNPTIFWNDSNEAISVDPCINVTPTAEFVKNNNLVIKAILLTHGHLDHVIGCMELHSMFPEAPIYIHKDDEELYLDALNQAKNFGFEVTGVLPKVTYFDETKQYTLLPGVTAEAIKCTGHTKGHLVYTIRENNVPTFLLTGDIILANNVPGKYEFSYDLVQHDAGIDAVKALDLPANVTVIPGHADLCTFADLKSCPYTPKN